MSNLFPVSGKPGEAASSNLRESGQTGPVSAAEVCSVSHTGAA